MKKILIIGASSDIGSAISYRLALSGHILILAGRNSEKLESIRSRVSKNCEVNTYNIDVTDHKQIKKTYSEIKEKFKFIDWIIYSAGHIEKEESRDDKDILNMFEINTIAFTKIIYYFEDILSENGGTLAISSTAAIWGNPDYPIYSASKAALNIFTASLHKKWLPTNRFAFSICPGPTNTKMREMIAHDASLHQETTSIAGYVEKILKEPQKFADTSLYIIRENQFFTLNQESKNVPSV